MRKCGRPLPLSADKQALKGEWFKIEFVVCLVFIFSIYYQVLEF